MYITCSLYGAERRTHYINLNQNIGFLYKNELACFLYTLMSIYILCLFLHCQESIGMEMKYEPV